jgi:hypothetical protein
VNRVTSPLRAQFLYVVIFSARVMVEEQEVESSYRIEGVMTPVILVRALPLPDDPSPDIDRSPAPTP